MCRWIPPAKALRKKCFNLRTPESPLPGRGWPIGPGVECGQRSADSYNVTGVFKVRFMERNNKLTPYARNLRKSMTKEEAHLWYQFLCSIGPDSTDNMIGNYIVDFYCSQARLVVELDGSQHCEPGKMEYDQKRTDYFRSQGLEVLQFSNLDVWCKFRGVCEMIDIAVKRKAGCVED